MAASEFGQRFMQEAERRGRVKEGGSSKTCWWDFCVVLG